MTDQQKKYLKIGGIVVLVLILAYAVYYWYKNRKPSMASTAQYGPYSDNVSPAQYNDFIAGLGEYLGGLGQNIGSSASPVWSNEVGARGYLKGYNVAMSKASVGAFKNQIQQYIAGGGKPHYNVTVGEYLNA